MLRAAALARCASRSGKRVVRPGRLVTKCPRRDRSAIGYASSSADLADQLGIKHRHHEVMPDRSLTTDGRGLSWPGKRSESPLQFGVQFFPDVQPEQKSAAEYLHDALDLVEESEKLGFSHVRIVE